ncbi:hypothetical protein QQS21_008445 [Conoideocrella luteorostrata]|uniref:Transcription factor domain-containing protein n=1 Tax=Conoideocrella luteorostrata TaxID=1105319 RepID=A0AAJ0CL90_9HYPO|nr:hypothetical protein QQS21_008445 [Conoideocrella luteorostrata]
MRTAQHLRTHDEATDSKCTVFEGEMRRRLCWSMMLFDNRMSDIASSNSFLQVPIWNCETPLNVSDSELQKGMKEAPVVTSKVSDCIVAVVRSELGDHVRRSATHVDYINSRPGLTTKVPSDGESGDTS